MFVGSRQNLSKDFFFNEVSLFQNRDISCCRTRVKTRDKLTLQLRLRGKPFGCQGGWDKEELFLRLKAASLWGSWSFTAAIQGDPLLLF